MLNTKKEKKKVMQPNRIAEPMSHFNTCLSCRISVSLPAFFLFPQSTVFGCEEQSDLKENIENTQRNAAFIHKVPGAYRPHSSRFPKIYHCFCSLGAKDIVFEQKRPIRSQSRCRLTCKNVQVDCSED